MAATPLRVLPAQPAPAPAGGPAPARGASGRPGAPSRALQDAWVARLKARDPRALAEVVEAFGERITAVVAGMLRDRDAVDDVVQATFTKAWFRIAAFAGESSLYTWLYRVAVNACKDHAKGRARRPAVLLGDLAARSGDAQDDAGGVALEAPSQPPLEGLERRELRAAVQRAIARLPERFRSVLALREIEGLPYQEIATVLGLSLGTVESRLFRARQRLSALLEREGLRPSAPGQPGHPGPDDLP
ncbi:MAG: RNA polymerase sigma factor [Planctomycetia bacterium]